MGKFNKESLRNSILQEVERLSTKQRHALFSQPPPLSLGDDFNVKKKIGKYFIIR